MQTCSHHQMAPVQVSQESHSLVCSCLRLFGLGSRPLHSWASSSLHFRSSLLASSKSMSVSPSTNFSGATFSSQLIIASSSKAQFTVVPPSLATFPHGLKRLLKVSFSSERLRRSLVDGSVSTTPSMQNQHAHECGKAGWLEHPRTSERHLGHPRSPVMYILRGVGLQIIGIPSSRAGLTCSQSSCPPSAAVGSQGTSTNSFVTSGS